ncbi:unnamed protein product [Adineta steineri]|uniref:Uncharacterized protein n=1 Tax=Adineta steineri TaxID=433720 RepID=A0A819W5S5_9BILA|nr:unnamed protein product [Adineta steineri]
MITTTTTSTSTSTSRLGNNLLLNPGGRDGVLRPWVVGGNSNPRLDNGTFDPGYLPRTGLFQFAGGTGSFGTLTQTVAIVDADRLITTSKIDGGYAAVNLSYWSRSAAQREAYDGATIRNEHYVVPFMSDHPRQTLGNVIKRFFYES